MPMGRGMHENLLRIRDMAARLSICIMRAATGDESPAQARETWAEIENELAELRAREETT